MKSRLTWLLILATIILVPHYVWALGHGRVGKYLGNDGWTAVLPVTGTSGSCSTPFDYNGTCYIYVDSTAVGATCTSSTSTRYDTVGAPPLANTCLTPTAAVAKMRDGKSDWLLVARGTTYTADFGQINTSGASCAFPQVISTYGTGARPLFNIASNIAAGIKTPVTPAGSTKGSNMFIEGLEFYAYQRDPTQLGNYVASTVTNGNPTAFSFGNRLSCVTLENNKATYFAASLAIQNSADKGTNDGLVSENITLRRNVFANSWSAATFVSQVNGLSMIENDFDMTSWNDISSAVTTVSYTGPASPAVFTWPSTPLFPDGTGGQLRCLTTQDGLTAGTPYYPQSISGSTFNLSASPSGTPLLATTGTGSISCYWVNPAIAALLHNFYVHDNYPFNIHSNQDIAYGNINTNDSTGWQFRNGGPINNNLVALGGYMIPTVSMVNYGSYVTQNNVVTEMIYGSNLPSAANTRIATGIATAQDWNYNIGVSGIAKTGDQLHITFSCPSCGTGVIPALTNAPITVDYSFITGKTSAQTATEIAAAINANADLTAFGVGAGAADNTRDANDIDVWGIGPTGQMIITMSVTGVTAPTEIMSQGPASNNNSPFTITNNLVFNYDAAASIGMFGSGIFLADNTQGATISNNVVCNWGATPYREDSAPQAITAVASASGGAKTRLTMSRAYFIGSTGQRFGTHGQGPVTITGFTGGGAYLNGNTYGTFVSATQIDVNVAFAGSTFTGSPTITTNPYSANVLSGNRIGTGATSDCSSASVVQGGLPANNAANITLHDYLQAIGLGPSCAVPNACTDQDFINFEKLQSKQNWNPDLRACKVNDWMRAQFGMTQVGCPTGS